MGTIVFVLIIVTVVLLIKYGHKVKLSEKNKKRLESVKNKIFFNALIRYLLMNALKFYMSAMVVLSRSWDDKVSVSFSFLFLVFLVAIPIVSSRLLYKENDHLIEEPKRKKIGNFYTGRNVKP